MDSASAGECQSPLLPAGKFACSSVRVTNPFSNVETHAPICNNWCVTKIDAVKFSFIWRIDHFSLHQEEEYISSSTFFAGPDNEFEWCLEAFPRGDKKVNENHLSLFLVLLSTNEVSVKFKFYILNAKNEKGHTTNDESSFKFNKGETYGWYKFVALDLLLEEANGLLPDDNLTILCEGCIGGVCTDISGHVDGLQAEVAKCTLSDDLGSLFENQKLSDVTLAVGEKEFLAHKAILAARSPVFAAMFDEMKEGQQNRVVIEDVDYEVLAEMLVYIYSGKSPSIKSMANHLLAAADKYDVAGLKLMCQETLCSTITVENVVDLLVLADKHCAEQLKIQVGNFINTHVKDVIRTPEWKSMILKYPHLFAEAFEALAYK